MTWDPYLNSSEIPGWTIDEDQFKIWFQIAWNLWIDEKPKPKANRFPVCTQMITDISKKRIDST